MDLKVTARPADARLFLDGAPLDGNPASRRVPRDGSEHTLRAEAPGHLPATRTITFDKDFHIELALEMDPGEAQTAGGQAGRNAALTAPAAPRPAEALPRTAPAQEPAPEDVSMKRPAPKAARPLDTSNPFTNP
jgi:serine/threonine-protein kinase